LASFNLEGQKRQKRRFGRCPLHANERWFSSRRATGRHPTNSLEVYLCVSKKGLKKDSLAGWTYASQHNDLAAKLAQTADNGANG